MSRSRAAFGIGLATLFGIAISYTTFQPELAKQKAEREGDFQEHHPTNDQAISQAIMSDLKEAGEQVKPDGSKGFAWGIREAIWGRPEERVKSGHDVDGGQEGKR